MTPDLTLGEPEHIAISKSRGIKIDWKDSHRSEYTLAYLRDECPCATCTGAWDRTAEKQLRRYRSAACEPFQMFKPALRMASVEEAGSYAIRIRWSDGHNTGTYSWDHLRRICPCEQCRAAAR